MPDNETETFDPQQEFSEIQERYEDDPTQSTFNLLLTGEVGTGKTHLLKTARKPVHVDSFDDGGTKTLREEIKNNEVLADTRWENDNPMSPSVFTEWVDAFNRRKKGGYFEHIATYALDSLSGWQDAIMNYILDDAGIPGQTPRWGKDYQPHKTKVKNLLGRLLSLPCDVVVTGHLDSETDEVTGRTSYRLMTTGNNTVQIPRMFDEVWVMDPKEQGGEVSYRVLTKATGRYIARSRLASNGKIKTYETPHLKQILARAGMPTNDLPLPGEK